MQSTQKGFSTMTKRKKIYEGKAKILYKGAKPGTVIQYFKDDATAFNNKKRGTIEGKGVLNNRISSFIMQKLSNLGIPTHFIEELNMREQLIHQVEIVPLEVIVRNVAAGSFATRYKLTEGQRLPRPIIEYCYKSDDMGDPFVNTDMIQVFSWATGEELEQIYSYALRINDILSGMFAAVGIYLIDFKIEFGRYYDEDADQTYIMLADEISPDTCRLWDEKTLEKMDKDRFRRDLGKVEDAYREVARRLGVLQDRAGSGEVVRLHGTVAPKARKTGDKKGKKD